MPISSGAFRARCTSGGGDSPRRWRSEGIPFVGPRSMGRRWRFDDGDVRVSCGSWVHRPGAAAPAATASSSVASWVPSRTIANNLMDVQPSGCQEGLQSRVGRRSRRIHARFSPWPQVRKSLLNRAFDCLEIRKCCRAFAMETLDLAIIIAIAALSPNSNPIGSCSGSQLLSENYDAAPRSGE